MKLQVWSGSVDFSLELPLRGFCVLLNRISDDGCLGHTVIPTYLIGCCDRAPVQPNSQGNLYEYSIKPKKWGVANIGMAWGDIMRKIGISELSIPGITVHSMNYITNLFCLFVCFYYYYFVSLFVLDAHTTVF